MAFSHLKVHFHFTLLGGTAGVNAVTARTTAKELAHLAPPTPMLATAQWHSPTPAAPPTSSRSSACPSPSRPLPCPGRGRGSEVRTLPALYNTRPTWLDLAHRKLDAVVLDAYGWPHDVSDEEILERLLALNRARAISNQAQGEACHC